MQFESDLLLPPEIIGRVGGVEKYVFVGLRQGLCGGHAHHLHRPTTAIDDVVREAVAGVVVEVDAAVPAADDEIVADDVSLAGAVAGLGLHPAVQGPGVGTLQAGVAGSLYSMMLRLWPALPRPQVSSSWFSGGLGCATALHGCASRCAGGAYNVREVADDERLQAV